MRFEASFCGEKKSGWKLVLRRGIRSGKLVTRDHSGEFSQSDWELRKVVRLHLTGIEVFIVGGYFIAWVMGKIEEVFLQENGFFY